MANYRRAVMLPEGGMFTIQARMPIMAENMTEAQRSAWLRWMDDTATLIEVFSAPEEDRDDSPESEPVDQLLTDVKAVFVEARSLIQKHAADFAVGVLTDLAKNRRSPR